MSGYAGGVNRAYGHGHGGVHHARERVSALEDTRLRGHVRDAHHYERVNVHAQLSCEDDDAYAHHSPG